MEASTLFNILLFSWFFCGAITVLSFNHVASKKVAILNKRLQQRGEQTTNWMNPQNLIKHRSKLLNQAPEEYKALMRVFWGWMISCIILLVMIQAIFILAPLFVS